MLRDTRPLLQSSELLFTSSVSSVFSSLLSRSDASICSSCLKTKFEPACGQGDETRSPLETPESDRNLEYAKVRIPRRSALNRRKRDSIKKTPQTADLRRLMADSNLRCQVANAMVATLPPIPDGTCISYIPTDMADVILPTAAELAPRSKRPRGAQGWCVDLGVEAEMNAA